MYLTKSTFGKIVVGTVMSVALLLPTTSSFAATTSSSSGQAVKAASMTSAQKADKVIQVAKSLMGKVSYQYGKNDTKNLIFDCSSFTKYVYSKVGVSIKWGANSAYKQGKPVAKKDLKKGDLVYLSVKTKGKIGHVGIYMGNGKFIHNVNPKSDVVISDLNSGYWKDHYVAAARYF